MMTCGFETLHSFPLWEIFWCT